MKKISLQILFLFSSLFSWSQKTTIKWGEENKKDVLFGSLINCNGSSIIKLCFDKKLVKNVKTPVLTSYNEKLEIQAEKVINVNETGSVYNNLLSVKGKPFLITSRLDKATNAITYFAQAINIQTLDMQGDIINLGGESLIKSPEFQFSFDSSKILMIGKAQTKEGGNAKYYVNVLDKNMQKLWSTDIELPYASKNIIIQNIFLTNIDELGFIIRHYNEQVSEAWIIEQENFGQKVPEYEMKLLLYNKENKKPAECSLDLEDKFIHSVQIMDDNPENITLFELYKQKVVAGCITGFVTATVNKKTFKVKLSTPTQFPQDLLVLVNKDKQARDNAKDPGLTPAFKIVGMVERVNGSKDFVLEYNLDYCLTEYHSSIPETMRYTMGGTTHCTCYTGDIIDINIAKDGKAICSRIPKLQLEGSSRWYSSFKMLPYEDKLLIFYNDDPDNANKDINKKPDDVKGFTKCSFVMACIDKEGKVTRQILFNAKDNNIIPAINISAQPDKNRILLYGFTVPPVSDRIGILTIQ